MQQDTEVDPGHGNPLCLVLQPFGGAHDEDYDDVFAPAATEAGLRPVRGDNLFRPGAVVEQLWELLRASDVVLADLTGKNPNVYYELGLVHAAQKPAVLVTQDIGDIPFDLRALRHIAFDTRRPTWSNKLRTDISHALVEVLENPASAVLSAFRERAPGLAPMESGIEERLIRIEQGIRRSGGESNAERLAGAPLVRGVTGDGHEWQIKAATPGQIEFCVYRGADTVSRQISTSNKSIIVAEALAPYLSKEDVERVLDELRLRYNIC